MQFVDLFEAPVAGLADQLNHLIRDLNSLAAEFPPSSVKEDTRAGGRDAARAYVQAIQEALVRDRESIARSVADECNRTVLVGEQKLQRFLGLSAQVREALTAPLRAAARRVVLSHIQRSTQRFIEESARAAADGAETACARLVAEFVQEQAATPAVARERLVVLVPESVDPRQLQEAFAASATATLVAGRTNGITICRERAPRPLEDVADEVVQSQELYRQLAEKLRTREDVDWAPLGPGRGELRSTPGAEAVVLSSQ
jgi:hypothetical protein